MNQQIKKHYRIDLILQSIVYVPMMIFYVLGFIETAFLVLGALLQFFVGIAQVSSGAFHTVWHKNPLHKKYFIGAISYLAFLFLGGALIANALYGSAVLIIFVLIIPVGIATWYYRLTLANYKKTNDTTNSFNPNISPREDVLDDLSF